MPVKHGRNRLILDTVHTEIVNLNHAPVKHGRNQLILDTVHTEIVSLNHAESGAIDWLILGTVYLEMVR